MIPIEIQSIAVAAENDNMFLGMRVYPCGEVSVNFYEKDEHGEAMSIQQFTIDDWASFVDIANECFNKALAQLAANPAERAPE